MFKVGDKVQLRKRCKVFKFGQGGVNKDGGEVGIIIATNHVGSYREVQIKFSSGIRWSGMFDEVKKFRGIYEPEAKCTVAAMRGCCTTTEIYRLGGSAHGLGLLRHTKVGIIKRLNRLVKQVKNHACIVATTTTDQIVAAEALTEFGFYRTTAMRKNQHPNVDLILWHYPILGYIKEVS